MREPCPRSQSEAIERARASGWNPELIDEDQAPVRSHRQGVDVCN